jgi:hypothetical protein
MRSIKHLWIRPRVRRLPTHKVSRDAPVSPMAASKMGTFFCQSWIREKLEYEIRVKYPAQELKWRKKYDMKELYKNWGK